jgi:hypothetical protein
LTKTRLRPGAERLQGGPPEEGAEARRRTRLMRPQNSPVPGREALERRSGIHPAAPPPLKNIPPKPREKRNDKNRAEADYFFLRLWISALSSSGTPADFSAASMKEAGQGSLIVFLDLGSKSVKSSPKSLL